MEWLTVIGLIVFGISLIVIEVIFVPGTTVVGIAGFLVGGFGIYLSYGYFGNTTGHITLVAGVVTGIAVLVYTFKTKAWERFSLKDEITGRFNDDYKLDLNVGDEGITISSVRPIGKALFDEKEVEVKSNGYYLSENQPIKIIRIEHNRIIVEPINQNK